jgi:hypothetical protein
MVRVEDKRPFHLLTHQLQFTMKPVKYHCTICTSSYVTRSTKLQNLGVVLTIRLEDGIPRYFQPLQQKSIPRAQSLIECFDASKLNRHTNIVHHNVSISVTSFSIQTGAMQPWSQRQPPLTLNTPVQIRFTCLKQPVPTECLMNWQICDYTALWLAATERSTLTRRRSTFLTEKLLLE